ncbi:MAG: acyl-CoA dehydratase activase-related protein [Bacteroidales bacterium]
MLTKDYNEDGTDERVTIGIPRALSVFFQQFPFWNSFFTSLGFRSSFQNPPTSRQ